MKRWLLVLLTLCCVAAAAVQVDVPLRISEPDGSPDVASVRWLKFPNGSLSHSEGVVTVSSTACATCVQTTDTGTVTNTMLANSSVTVTAGSGLSGGGSVSLGSSITLTNAGVTSVGLSLPSIFTVSGSPVTTTGTLTGTLASQSAGTVLAGPSSGGAASPTFRALAQADLPQMDGVRVYNSADLSINNDSFTVLTFDSERYDRGNLHSTSSLTSRLTAARAGIYPITGHIRFAGNAAGVRYLGVLLNGATVIAQQGALNAAGSADILSVSTLYYLNAGDYVELQAYQNSGGLLSVTATGNKSPEFAMQWMGP